MESPRRDPLRDLPKITTTGSEFCRVGIMGLYENWVLPRLLDLGMCNYLLDAYRRRAIKSGLNLSLYGPAVGRVIGLDPLSELLHLARKRAAHLHIPVSFVRASAEHVPFADAAFDAVVMTWTLCSIPNPIAALIEMRRVLKPGGRLLFVEHGLSPEIRIARWQHRLTPYWKRIGGGCNLDRKMDDLIRAAGFQVDAVETGYMKRPKPGTFMFQGWATKQE
jgi:SAM-dependent methyltransferase